MLRAMRTAATGMKTQEMNVDNIANNLANVNTTGFKKSRIQFQDIFYQQQRIPGRPGALGVASPASLQVGYGAAAVATQRMFTQGELLQTGGQTDVAIMGEGFFRLSMPDGSAAFTRDGSFHISGEGQLVTSDGYLLDPGIVLPENSRDVSIGPDGTVSVTSSNDMFPQVVGQIELARFTNSGGLSAIGQNLFVPSAASGEPVYGVPAGEGFGRLTQGYLEISNVEIVEEMIALIAAQRAYETNSKAIKASEDMMSMANDLAR